MMFCSSSSYIFFSKHVKCVDPVLEGVVFTHVALACIFEYRYTVVIAVDVKMEMTVLTSTITEVEHIEPNQSVFSCKRLVSAATE